MPEPPRESLEIIDQHPRLADMRSEVLEGLSRHPRTLSPKFFYDERGSELFDQITRLDEYYPTRTEIAILEANAAEITRDWDADLALIELGSGSSQKVRILLDAYGGPLTYMPVDISKDYLLASAEAIDRDYPDLEVVPVCSDYTVDLQIPHWEAFARRVLFFPGSTIGNFEPEDASNFLRSLASKNTHGDRMLIGVDLEKDTDILNAAYDDSSGITAEFNLNILRRINREIGSDFNLDHFEHRAFYDSVRHRIEMHLVSTTRQTVTIGSREFHFEKGETIHTENSYKYSKEGFEELIRGSGFRIAHTWIDADGLFSVHELEVV